MTQPIRFLSLIIVLLLTLLYAHEENEKARWRAWSNAGFASSVSTIGPTGLMRINRITDHTFRDVRLSGYGVGSDSYFHLRYKSSSRYRKPLDRLYYFSTLVFQRNTRNNVSIRYHYNQGLGLFASRYRSGHINVEAGHAFDMADYLNDTRKTSYAKGGLYLDQDIGKMALKVDAEYFHQISDIIDGENLSRTEVFLSLTAPLSPSLYIVLGYELEQIQDNNTRSETVLLLLGWKQKLNWTF